MKPTLPIITALLLAPLGALHAAGFGVVNGDFSDLSGLKPHGDPGWHQGGVLPR